MIFRRIATALRGLLKSSQSKVASKLPENVVQFGFLLPEELTDCGGRIMQVFGVTDYDRDYENYWEWVEGTNADGLFVNIRRPHNWTRGLYDKPIKVSANSPLRRLTAELIACWGTALSKNLNVEVWQGYLEVNPKDSDDFNFVVEQRFPVPEVPKTSAG